MSGPKLSGPCGKFRVANPTCSRGPIPKQGPFLQMAGFEDSFCQSAEEREELDKGL